MKIVNTVLIALFLFQGSLYACSCNGAIEYAKEVKAKVHKRTLPNRTLRRYVFECTGNFERLAHLDELDKDLLYMKALSYTRDEFENSETKTKIPQKFSELIPKENMDKLFKVMRKIYVDQETKVK